MALLVSPVPLDLALQHRRHHDRRPNWNLPMLKMQNDFNRFASIISDIRRD